MKKKPDWIRISLVAISIASFIILAIPNAKASENIAMVSMFEPDEGVMIPVIKSMVAPKESVKDFLYYFLFYGYYFYGFPFFASSALVTFPFQWLNQINNIQWLMFALRQVISVLPMILALLLLVYMHDRFKTGRSIILYLFLFLVPAIIRNGFWWHPDGIVLLLAVIVLFFLYTDAHKLGWRFLLAAFFCGILTATKLVGAYFFLAVALAIIWGLVKKDVTWKKAILMSAAFIGIMFATFIVSNPFLLFKSHRTLYINTFRKQTGLLALGYGIIYNRGLRASWPLMHQYYGEAVFLIATLGISIWNIIKKETRFLHALILAWFIPLTISVVTFSHFKYQYWLPVAIPLFANWHTILPDKFKLNLRNISFCQVVKVILLFLFLIQLILFGVQSTRMLVERTLRKESSAEVIFYDLAMKQLEPLESQSVFAYYDYRLYMPPKDNWATETSFELLDYDFIQSRNFDVLFLLQQRIRDYLNPNAVGVDPESFARSQAFYQDAKDGTIEGYYLIFAHETALLYLRQDVCQRDFDPGICQ
ncbi:MAG TPA: hypothetical protein PLE10_02160 [Brevefilum sp.]|nr:hypothetical protein [Brevefilum sp.]HOR18620.1 hypothetical protein [Brevefilum sp.]HPL68985.1 hypothetical protein [Brevefilum sp.]